MPNECWRRTHCWRCWRSGRCRAGCPRKLLRCSGAIISHEKTVKEAGLCDQAEINVQGEDEAKAQKEQADKVDIHSAARLGNAAEVKSVLAFYPDRVNVKRAVRVPCAPRGAVTSYLQFAFGLGRTLASTGCIDQFHHVLMLESFGVA